jgi:hypothetical protein
MSLKSITKFEDIYLKPTPISTLTQSPAHIDLRPSIFKRQKIEDMLNDYECILNLDEIKKKMRKNVAEECNLDITYYSGRFYILSYINDVKYEYILEFHKKKNNKYRIKFVKESQKDNNEYRLDENRILHSIHDNIKSKDEKGMKEKLDKRRTYILDSMNNKHKPTFFRSYNFDFNKLYTEVDIIKMQNELFLDSFTDNNVKESPMTLKDKIMNIKFDKENNFILKDRFDEFYLKKSPQDYYISVILKNLFLENKIDDELLSKGINLLNIGINRLVIAYPSDDYLLEMKVKELNFYNFCNAPNSINRVSFFNGKSYYNSFGLEVNKKNFYEEAKKALSEEEKKRLVKEYVDKNNNIHKIQIMRNYIKVLKSIFANEIYRKKIIDYNKKNNLTFQILLENYNKYSKKNLKEKKDIDVILSQFHPCYL